MTDDLSKKAPQDKSKVNVDESREMKWWTKALNTTEEKLKDAVKTVGTSVEAIRNHLKK